MNILGFVNLSFLLQGTLLSRRLEMLHEHSFWLSQKLFTEAGRDDSADL